MQDINSVQNVIDPDGDLCRVYKGTNHSTRCHLTDRPCGVTCPQFELVGIKYTLHCTGADGTTKEVV